MNHPDFAHWSEQAARWGARYRATLPEQAVRPNIKPGAVLAKLMPSAPEMGEDMAAIFADFERIIAPAMTHWQHPRFFAYFPANSPAPSVIAEQLSASMAAQCMLWQTSPAATELEMCMIDWMRQALGLPDGFKGALHDGASSATLSAILTMRERALGYTGNRTGLSGGPRLRVYCSAEAHSSVMRAIWFSGIGEDNLVPIPIKGPLRGADAGALATLIADDLAAGYTPAGVVINVGATGSGATDPVAEMVAVARRHDLFTHVDAAWAGTAMLCPELRGLWAGIDDVDSLVISGHKWLGAHPGAGLHFVRSPHDLNLALAAHPTYLDTPGQENLVNFSEWGVQLGRPFRALKLWFLLRSYGLEGIRAMVRQHIKWTNELYARLAATPEIEIVTKPILALFTFRLAPKGVDDLNALNLRLIEAINDGGRIYLTQTNIDGKLVLRMQVGSYSTTAADIDIAFDAITETARRVMN
ncbi:MAG: aspartate aminotransferase family protein [Alphaproteobacteria bacterium]|nr:aspartate aminotransferase family protein [Alphaproteobacteria bacterium]MDE2041909.1 aspartate aminotransferase family protein [Alphaproteobacteria bacterium]MDE2341344.1 aspartate aminotransferase family protein [Alphaproteobacteria bacterium]